jgi:hypothetical protein
VLGSKCSRINVVAASITTTAMAANPTASEPRNTRPIHQA